MYVVYCRPSDFPNSFVVRRFTVGDRGTVPDPLPFAVGNTLEAVRAVVPFGLYRMDRWRLDEPQIVEFWL
jgi:hypothetical protein